LTLSDDEVQAVSSCKIKAQIRTKLSQVYQSLSDESKQAEFQKYYGVMAGLKIFVKKILQIQIHVSQLRSLEVVIEDEAEVARIVSRMWNKNFRPDRQD